MGVKVDQALVAHDLAAARVADLEEKYNARRRGDPGDPKIYVGLLAARDDLAHAVNGYNNAIAAEEEDFQAAQLAEGRARAAELARMVQGRTTAAAELDAAAGRLRALLKADFDTGRRRGELARHVLTFRLNDDGIANAATTMSAIQGISHDHAQALAEFFYAVTREDGLMDAIRPFITWNLFALASVGEPLTFTEAARRDAEHVTPRLPRAS